MFHSPPNEAPQQGVPNLIEEQPENGRVRVEVGVRVDGRQPQQIEQTRTASLTTEAELRQITSGSSLNNSCIKNRIEKNINVGVICSFLFIKMLAIVADNILMFNPWMPLSRVAVVTYLHTATSLGNLYCPIIHLVLCALCGLVDSLSLSRPKMHGAASVSLSYFFFISITLAQ
ncbi:hypothetical protein F7725_024145 [Dissostichus mawsoni]|uniref:Uncharacterized protein n=1 Tax=Dissostichus mawsoni TaxID=36200 RepID=A0A7J5XYI2_DISMA|nr:hypothetical protein F7725_024145 [Dissostichus mawsoni]